MTGRSTDCIITVLDRYTTSFNWAETTSPGLAASVLVRAREQRITDVRTPG
jgi:hypothetical protein